MKKKVSFLLVCLSSIMLVAGVCGLTLSIGGCGKPKTEVVKINGFNNYDEIVAFDYDNINGVVNINGDKKYITEGEKSAEVKIISKVGAQTPTFRIKSATEISEKKNITDVVSFHIDVFSLTDAEVYFAFKANTPTNTCVSYSVKLKNNQWNSIEIAVNRDVTHFIGDNISNYEFSFMGIQDTLPGVALDKPVVFYLDNFYCTTTDKKHDSKEIKKIQSIVDSIVNLQSASIGRLKEVQAEYEKLTDDQKLAVYNYDQLQGKMKSYYAGLLSDARKNDNSVAFFFDEEFGLAHVERVFGGIKSYEYSTAKKFGSEKGSLKVSFDEIGEIWTTLVYDKGTYDAENYNEIKFAIFNDSNQEKSVNINWMLKASDPVKLKCHEWTEFAFPAKLLAVMPGNELEFAGYKTSFEDGTGAHPTGDIYISRISSEEFDFDEATQNVVDMISALPGNITSEHADLVSNCFAEFAKLTDSQKDALITKNFDKLLKSANEAYKSLVVNMRKTQTDLVFAYSDVWGLGQVKSCEQAYISYDKERKMGGLKGALKLDFKDGAGPWVDLVFDKYDFNISRLDFVKLNVYNESDKTMGIYVNWAGRDISTDEKPSYQPYPIAPNQVTEIVVPAQFFVKDGGSSFNICGYDPTTMQVYKPTGNLYISSAFGINRTDDVTKIINDIKDLPSKEDITIDSKNKVDDIWARFNKLNSSEKQIVKYNNYKKLVDVSLKIEHISRPNDVMFFDKPIIFDQVRGAINFEDGKKIDGRNAYTSITGNAENDKNDWKNIFLDNPAIIKLSDFDELTFEVYYEENNDIGENAIITYFWAQSFILKPGEWNTITVKKGEGWKGFPNGTYPKYHINDLSGLEIDYNISGTLYFGSMKVRNYNIDEETKKVIDDINFLKPIEQLEIADKEYIEALIARYNSLTDLQKNTVYLSEVDKLNSYLMKIYELEYFYNGTTKGTIVEFGKDYGLYQVYSPNTEISYAENVLGTNKNGLKVIGKAHGDKDGWVDLIVKHPGIADISAYKQFKLEYYYEKTDPSFNNEYLFFNWNNPPTKIEEGLNQIIVSDLTGWDKLGDYRKDMNGFNININVAGNFYITLMEVGHNNEADEFVKIPALIDHGTKESVNNAWNVVEGVSFDSTIKFPGENGSLKLSFPGTTSGNDITHKLTNIPVGVVSMYIYNGGSKTAHIEFNWRGAHDLAPKNWTKVTINSNILSIDGSNVVTIHFLGEPFENALYISSMRIEKDEQATNVLNDINALINGGVGLANIEKAQSVVDAYNNLTDEQKALFANDVQGKVNTITEVIAQVNADVETFGKLEKHFDVNSALSVNELISGTEGNNAEIKLSDVKTFKGESKSIEIAINGQSSVNVLHCHGNKDLLDVNTLVAWMYNATDKDLVINIGWQTGDIRLTKNNWTKVQFTATQFLNGKILPIWGYGGEAVTGSLYISSVAIVEKITENEKAFEFTSTSMGEFIDRTEGSTAQFTEEITAFGHGVLKFDVTNSGSVNVFHKIDESKLNGASTLAVWIFNDTDKDWTYNLGWLTGDKTLVKGEWTKVEFTPSQFMNGKILPMWAPNGEPVKSGALYITSIYKIA